MQRTTPLQNFSLTGFIEQQIENRIKQQLKSFGCTHSEKLTQFTNVLVVNSTRTQKFKIAKLYRNPIPCVTQKWIEDSVKRNHLLQPTKYLIGQAQIFLGIQVAVCGFDKQKTQIIQRKINDRGGRTFSQYKAAYIIRNYQELPHRIDAILAEDNQIVRAKHAKLPSKNDQVVPLVGKQWLYDSLKSKRCKFPSDYAVNQINIENAVAKNIFKVGKKFDNFMQTNDIMDKSSDFLQDTLIFIDKDFPSDISRILKNLIAICGGYWTDKFTSIVTHVLVMQIDEYKHQQFKKYGTKIYILRPEWLLDCILLYNRVPEQDYIIRCFKINEQARRNLYQEQYVRNNQNSMNFNSLPGFGDRRTISSSNTLPLHFETQKKKQQAQPKTDIFKNRNFYFPPQIVNDQFYKDLLHTILNAGGQTFDKINSKLKVYVPLKDSPIVQQIKKQMKASQYNFILISDRWIKECIKKNNFIEPNLKTDYHFRAYPFATPLTDFHKFVFDIVGCQQVQRLRIRELLPILGSTKKNPNKKQITHIICGPDWKNTQSQQTIDKVKKQNQIVQLIQLSWLLDCLSKRKTLNHAEYLIDMIKMQQPRTPQKKSEQNSLSSEQKTIQTQNKSQNKLVTP